jgi:flavin reductase (DIM6/NTAB) family NADH-FMN oxidoreductase RutF
MEYDPEQDDHGLPFNPFKACVVPRPIGWISTQSADGVDNLAPYSQFQMLTYDPPIVMFSANQTPEGRRKDTVVNVEATGEFVWNMATYDLREAVNLSSTFVDSGVDEFEFTGLAKAASVRVRPPRVADSPIHFECVHMQTLRLPGNTPMGTVDVVIGKVILIHIKDDAITGEGRLDIPKIRPLARLGYYDYTAVESVFEMKRPGESRHQLRGMEGKPDRRSTG